MNDFSVCSNCFTVTDEVVQFNESDSFDCGCNSGFLISWWRLRMYDSTLPLFPEVGRKYELKSRIITAHDVQLLEITDDDMLRDIYRDIPKQEKLSFVTPATATV